MKKIYNTVLDVSNRHVKLLQAHIQRGKAVLVACDIRPLGDFTDAELNKVVTEMVLSKSVSSDHFIFSIPRQFTIIKHLKLPSINDNEIKKMVDLQLVNKIPYTLEDVIYDYQVIQKDPSGYSYVMVVVVHKEITERFLRIFRRTGIHPNRMALSSVGVMDWLVYQNQKNSKLDITQTFALIDIDSEQTEICICQDKKLLYARSIRYGSKDLAEENIMGILKEIELTVSSYVKDEVGPEIVKFLIVSSLPHAQDLGRQIENQFKKPVGYVSMMDNVFADKKINLSVLKESSGASVTAALGFLLGPEKPVFNLTPPEVHATKQSKVRRKELLKFFLLLMGGFILLISMSGLELYYKTVQLNMVNDELERMQKSAMLAEKKIDFVNSFERRMYSRVFIPEVIYQLHEMADEDISFRSISLDSDGRFSIQGYSSTQGGVNNFQSRLVRSKTFQEVSLEFSTKRKIFNQEITDFKIVAKIVGSYREDMP